MKTRNITLIILSAALMLTAGSGQAQRRGDSASITIGVVEAVRRVEFDAQAGRGALLGGAAGWALARNQSSGRQAAAAAAGAGLGAQRASKTCRIVATSVDLRGTGYAPHPDAKEWQWRIDQLAPKQAFLARLRVERSSRRSRSASTRWPSV